MPLPERYARKVPEMTAIWRDSSYFGYQGRIWDISCEKRHTMYGSPTAEQLGRIRQALVLSPEDIEYLIAAPGHETNNY